MSIYRKHWPFGVAALCLSLIAWWLIAFISCAEHEYPNNYSREYQILFYACLPKGPISALARLWIYIERHHDLVLAAITAAATVAIALFTLTLKQSTDRLWATTRHTGEQ